MQEFWFKECSHTQPATDFRIDHNYIGLNKDGDLALANQGLGISIASTSAAYAITNNVIANNNSHGIELYQVGQAAVATQLAGNLIGLNAAGTQASPIMAWGFISGELAVI